MTPYAFNIVVGLDFSPLAELALREAIETAGRIRTSAIHVLSVVDRADSPAARNALETMQVMLEIELTRLPPTADVHAYCHVQTGDAAREILSLADDVEADLIVVGTNGRRAVARLVMGSVAHRVVRDATCPVLVMRPRRYAPHPDLRPEPPCPDCLATRARSRGHQYWCEPHTRPWTPPHRYTYRDGTLHPFHADGMGPA